MSILTKWWILQTCVENCKWSKLLVKFCKMNTELGNQDTYRAADWIFQDGRAQSFLGSNDEFQLIIKFESMKKPLWNSGLKAEMISRCAETSWVRISLVEDKECIWGWGTKTFNNSVETLWTILAESVLQWFIPFLFYFLYTQN